LRRWGPLASRGFLCSFPPSCCSRWPAVRTRSSPRKTVRNWRIDTSTKFCPTGNIHWDREKKAATIRVMDSSGYHTDLAAMLKDMQVTVVHELVHLELASLPVAEADRSNQEFAIDHLTDALLAADAGSCADSQSAADLTICPTRLADSRRLQIHLH